MKATVKTPDGRVFTGELVEERKGFEKSVCAVRISSSCVTGHTIYPVRLSILSGCEWGADMGVYEQSGGLPGAILTEKQVYEVMYALSDTLVYYRSNQ